MVTKYKIWVSDFIKKVSLEELAQMIMTFELKRAYYAERKNRKMVIGFPVESERQILSDGTHWIKRGITTVLFTEVQEYKRMIFYNHQTGNADYTNETGKAGYYPIPVVRFPDDVVEAVVEAVLKKGK